MRAVRERTLFRSLVAVVMGAFALPAAAVIYNSGFDPASFSGNALFQFDDACLATDGFHTAAQCNLTMLSAHVNITDDGSGGTGQLDFGPNTSAMQDLIISGGELVGIDTDLIGWVFASPCTGTGCASVPWWIQWQSDFATALDTDPVFLFSGNCDGPCFPNDTPAGTAFNVTFTRVSVPEPATLALVVGGLAAGWLVRRRAERRAPRA